MRSVQLLILRKRLPKRPAAIREKEIRRPLRKLSVVPARGNSVGRGAWVGTAVGGIAVGLAAGGGVGTQVTVTSSQIGPKVSSWARTPER